MAGATAEGGSNAVTELLIDWSNGDESAFDKLAPLVYEELRKLANHSFKSERPGHTLQSTELVHETYLRMIDQRRVHWQNRSHFYGIASQLMRRILVDHARAQQAAKRGSGRKLSLDEAQGMAAHSELDLIELDHALARLAAMDPRQARIVELRFFGGLTIEETGEVLGISQATVKREWTMAKAWLYGELSDDPA